MGDIILKLKLLWPYMRDLALSDWWSDVWRADLDETICCHGEMCGCRGITIRAQMEWNQRKEPQA